MSEHRSYRIDVDRLRRRPVALAGLVVLATIGAAGLMVRGWRLGWPTGASAGTGRPAADGRAVVADAAGGAVGAPAAGDSAGPGAGVVTGRLIDGVTGVAVRDAGVTLLELGRRTITVPGGFFRFEGIGPGVYTLVIGPAEGYLPHSREVRVLASGAPVGLTALQPAEPPVLIVPDYGGKVAACGGTGIMFPSESLVEPMPIQLTCIERVDAFPAPPPPGRLPLAVVDAAPGDLALVHQARLTVDLPAQPRYAPGVRLDLLRLDVDRLVWTPTGVLTVDAGGRTASGAVTALGTYMAAAPPFGTFSALSSASPTIARLNTGGGPEGQPVDVFPTGTPIIYLSFDYAGMSDTRVKVRTVNRAGEVLFEHTRGYDGDGRDDLPMAARGGNWPAGTYLTTVYVGSPPSLSSLTWRVAAEPTPAPAAPTWPAAVRAADAAGDAGAYFPQGSDGSGASSPPGGGSGAAGCRPPAAWFAYYVQPGDTLLGLARGTGADAALLARANCLGDLMIRAGQVLYLPTAPRGPKPGFPNWPPVYPTYPASKPTAIPDAGNPGQPWPPAGRPTPGGAPPGGPGALPWYTPPPPFQGQPFKEPSGPEPTLAVRPDFPPSGIQSPPIDRRPPQPVQPALPPPPAPRIQAPPAPPSGNAGGDAKGPRGPEPTLAPRP